MPPDDSDELNRIVREQLEAHQDLQERLLRDALNVLDDGASVRQLWSIVGLDRHRLGTSTLERARLNLDAAVTRLDRLPLPPRHARTTPHQPAAAPEVKPPASPPEPAKSLWERLDDVEEEAPSSPGLAPPRPCAAPQASERAPDAPKPWWPPYAVASGGVAIVVALLTWLLYSVH